jgi:hypothetical protein
MIGVTPAHAWTRDFKFINNTSYDIGVVGFKTHSDLKWNPVDGSQIPAGNSTNIKFKKVGPCHLDMKVVFGEHDSAEFTDINFCSTSRITLQANSDGSLYIDGHDGPDDDQGGK